MRSLNLPIRPSSRFPLVVAGVMMVLGISLFLFGIAKADVSYMRPKARAKQIMSIEQIHYGMFVSRCLGDEWCSSPVRVVRAPYADEQDGSLRIILFVLDPDKGFRNQSISLADYGVVPYQSGFWNAKNWLKSGE